MWPRGRKQERERRGARATDQQIRTVSPRSSYALRPTRRTASDHSRQTRDHRLEGFYLTLLLAMKQVSDRSFVCLDKSKTKVVSLTRLESQNVDSAFASSFVVTEVGFDDVRPPPAGFSIEKGQNPRSRRRGSFARCAFLRARKRIPVFNRPGL